MSANLIGISVYRFWKARLEGGSEDLKSLMLPTMYEAGNQDNPQPGAYRTRLHKGGPRVPVQIMLIDDAGYVQHKWKAGLTLTGWIDGKKANADQIAGRWHFCEAVSKGDLAHHKAHSRWPGEIPAASAEIGHNSGDVSLVDRLRDYLQSATSWITNRKVSSQEDADQCANYRTKLNDLKKSVKGELVARCKPYQDEINKIAAEYEGLVPQAERLNVVLREAMDGFAVAEKRRLEEEARAKFLAEQERVRKEREAIEAARAQQMRDDPIAALTSPEPELPLAPKAPEPVKVRYGGQHGKSASLRTHWDVEIVDYPATLQHYANHPDVIALVTKLARADVKNAKGSIAIPGARPLETQRVA